MYRTRHLLGGEQWFGWSVNSAKLSDLADLTRLAAKATSGNGRASLRESERSPRPSPPKRVRPRSLMESFAGLIDNE